MSAATTTQKPTHLRRQTSLGSIHSVNQSIGENIQVVVRVRPQDQSDAPPSWQVSPDASSIICIDSDEIGDEPDQLDAALRYSFDRVFEAGISTAELYHSTIEPMLDSFLSGINGTVMTYGQTGSGKTFTLSGTSSNPGVSILLVQDLIGRIHQPDQYNSSYQLQVSYFEIYNEEVFDLLASKTRKGESLRIRENADGVYIEGLNKRNVSNIDEVHQLLKRGAQNRSVAATIWNRESSRSHSILSIELEVYRREHEDIEIRRRSVLNVVDLAGSERIAKYSTDKSLDAIVRQKEGGNINKSLYSLASVVSHLAQGSSHIPYRNSRLTRILQPSLGGNSRTLICVCVSAAKHNIHETISSLKFAALAKTIHNEYSVNISSAKTTGTARLRETSSDCSSISVALDPSAGQNGLASDQIRQELERTQVEYDRMRRSVQETVQILNEAIDSMSHGDELALSLNQDQFADAIRPLISSLCLLFNQYSTSQIRSKQLNDELQRACSTLLQYSGMLQKRLGHFRKTVTNVTEELNHQDDYAMKTLCIDLKDQQIKYQNHRDIMNQVLQQYENRCNVLSLLLNHQTIKWSRDCYRMHRIQEMCRLCLTHLDLDRVKRHYHQIRKDHDSVIEQLGSLIMESCSSNWSTYRNPRLISIDLHESYQTQLDHYEMALHYRDQCVMKLDRERIMLRQELRRACSQIDNIRKQYKVKFDHLKAEQAQTCNLYEKTLLDNDLLQNKLESLGQRHLQTKDEYHRQIESLSSQNASLLVSYTALSEESDELKKEIQAQLQRNSELESTETRLRKDLQLSCAREQDHVQGQRQQSEQLERLRVSEANLKDSIKHLQDQVDGFHEEQHRDRLLIEKLRSSEMNLRQGLESAQIRQGQMQLDFDAKIRNLTDQESKLRQSVADHEQNEHRLNENIRTLTQEKLGLSEENQGHELKQISLLKKIESLSSSERDLRRINEDREVEQRRLLEQIKAMKEAEIDLRSQIQILEDKNMILCHSVNIGRQKEQNLISHCEEIQKEMETLNQQCQRRSEQYQAAQNQIQSLHRDREAQIFALKHQHEEFVQKLVHDHDDAVNELRKHIQTLTTRAVELQSKYSDVQMQNEEIHAVYAALQERFDVQKQRVEELQDQLTKSEAERVSLHISETGLQQRLQILANESVLQLAQHDKELLDLRDRLQQTRNQLIAEERRAGQYQTDLDKQCQELKELARALDQSQAFLTEMNREFDQSSGRVKELEHSLQLTRMQSQDHIYELQQQLQDSKRLHQQLDQDLSQLRADYNRLAEDRDQFRAQCQDTSISRDQLQTLLEKKEQDLADSATRQSQLQAQIDDLSNQCHDLRAELQNTKISARRAANDLKRDKIRSDTAHSIKLAQLRNEIEMFNSENNDLSAELALSKALLGFQKNVIESGSGTSSGKRTPRLHSRSSSISPRPLSGAISSSIPESDSNKPSSTALP